MKFQYTTLAVIGFFCGVSALSAVQRERFSFSFDNGTRWLKVEALSDEILHFELYESRGEGRQNRGPDDTPMWVSPMVDEAHYPQYKGASSFKRLGDEGVETATLLVKFSRELDYISYYDKVRKVNLTALRSEKLDESIKTLHIEKLEMKNVYGVGNLFNNAKDADGDWVGKDWNQRGHGNFRFGLELNDDFAKGGPSISQFPMIFVLGEKATNGFANYGMFLDQPYKMSWNFKDVQYKKSTGWTASMWGDQIRWFFFAGESLPAIRRQYLGLVGHAPLPPKSVFGHWVSKFGYNNWKEAEKDVASLRGNDFPLDGVALDLQWFGGSFGKPSTHRMGTLQFDTDREKFPDPKTNIQSFWDKYGVQFITIEESYIDSNSGFGDFRALAEPEYRRKTEGFNGFGFEKYNSTYLAHAWDTEKKSWQPLYVTTDYTKKGNPDHENWWGGGGMMDWSNPDARRYWHQLKRHALAKMNITNHWLDLGEPEMYFQDANYYGLPGLKKTDHGSVHNLYNLFWARGIADGYANAENEKELITTLTAFHHREKDPFTSGPRHFTLSRAGTVGSHRYGGMWSGDTQSNYQNLRAHLQTQGNMSLLGVDLYSSDTGGFFHEGRPPGNDFDREIVKQWAANSSLLDNPMRPHAWARDEGHEDNRRFGLDVRGDLDSNRANVRRRYELLPYTYSLAHQAYLTGEPMYPPLVYHFQDDLNVRKNGNVKMIGPSLAFGVVATAGEEERKVYLPKGDWIEYESNKWLHSDGIKEMGPFKLKRTERVPAAELRDHPDRKFFMVPVFARAGAIIPRMHVDEKTMNVHGRRTDKTRRDELLVRAFAAPDKTSFTLFEDDGVTTAYQKGAVRRTVLTQETTHNRSMVVIEAAKGTYQGAFAERENIVELVTDELSATDVKLNGDRCGSLEDFHAGKITCWFHPGPGLIRAGAGKLPVNTAKEFEFQLAK